MSKQHYGVYFPHSSIDIGQRFFFFNSLLNKPEANELTSSVISIISKTTDLLNDKNEEGLSIVDEALDFLKQMTEYSRQQEIEYFNNLKDLPSKLKKYFSSISNDSSFDYLNFINSINEYYSGINKYKNLLSYESSRLKELQNYFSEFRNLSKSKKKAYSTSINSKGEKVKLDFYTAFNRFLAEKNNTLINTQTISNRIQNFLEKNFKELWNSSFVSERFFELINNSPEKAFTLEEQHTLFLELLIKLSSSFVSSFSSELIKEEQALENTLLDNFFLNYSISQNDSFNNEAAIMLSEKINNIFNELQNSQTNRQKLFNRLFSSDETSIAIKNIQTNETKAKSTTFRGLNKESVSLINKILNDNNVQKSTLKGSARAKLLDRIKGQLSKNLNKKKSSITQNEVFGFLKDLATQSPTIIDLKTNTTDNYVSEIDARNGLISTAKVNGDLIYKNRKADTGGVFLPAGEVLLSANLPHGFFKKASDKIAEYFSSSFDPNNLSTAFSADIEKEMRKEAGFTQTEFSIEAETLRRLATWEKTCLDLRKDLEDSGMQAEEINKVLSEIQNTFQIEQSVKSYDKFDSNHGFSGGSLGGSLETQLQNIYQMFSYGGISLPDVEWLTFAIYNAGHGLLGSNSKNFIEDILSTVAVMLLFDDAGQEAIYLKDQVSQRYAYHSTKFLHLFVLNGVYFPASYILQLTYNGLVKSKNSIMQKRKGSRANIINPVSEKNIVGRRTRNGIMTTSSEQWSQTFEENKKSVQIQITFLAGFLDIIDLLNQQMNN